jgi:hypothetical protein
MSEHTTKSLAQADALLPLLKALPAGAERDELIDTAEALRRAIAAFHMEAIRFRMFSVDRLLQALGNPAEARTVFDQLRRELEAAGFHTRSHTAP